MTKKKNRKISFAILIFILLVVILGGSFYYLNQSKTKNTKASSENTVLDTTSQESLMESSTSSSILEASTSSSIIESTSVSEVNQTIDVNAMLNGDFSSVAGNWKNGEGTILTINNDGTTADGQTITIRSSQDTKGMVTGDIRKVTGALIDFLDAGAAFPNIVDHSDITQTRIIITQDIWDFPAESYYYKMSD